jgi:hypothetical protein
MPDASHPRIVILPGRKKFQDEMARALAPVLLIVFLTAACLRGEDPPENSGVKSGGSEVDGGPGGGGSGDGDVNGSGSERGDGGGDGGYVSGEMGDDLPPVDLGTR